MLSAFTIYHVNILVARTTREIETAYEKLAQSPILGCDTETSSLRARGGRLFSVQFSDGDLNVLVPTSEKVGLGKLEKLLSDATITKVFHNARFDLDFLRENGYQVESVYCTMLAEKILTKGAGQSISLAETLYRYYAVDLDKSQRAKFSKNWNGIWTKDLVNYALADVVYLPRLMYDQTIWLKRLGLTEEYIKLINKIV